MGYKGFIRRIYLYPERLPPGSYAAAIPSIRLTRQLELRAPVTFFTGENGSGKSTLLEAAAVAWGFNPEGGSIHFCFSTRDTHSDLYRAVELEKSPIYPEDGFFLRAESFYNVATQVEGLRLNLEGYGGKSLHAQSHGESFLSLTMSRFRGRGLYMLDEPESALSPARQMALLVRIHQLVGNGSQLIIATHSPILLAYPGAEIFAFSGEGICPCRYEDTQSVQITRRFLENPERMVKELLKEDDDG